MDFSLTHEQEMLVTSLRQFVEKELQPHEFAVDRADDVPPELAASIRRKAIDLGFYAFNMPESAGGPGLDYLTQALVERELGRTSWALHVFVARPSKILMACKGDQIERYLKPTVRGERVDCFALTEPDAGSDAMGIRTRAVRDGDDYVINGSKHFISHADTADFVILFAVTGEEEVRGQKRKRVTCFLIDKDTPGMTVRRGPHCTSLRGYHQSEIFLSDCRVSTAQILGEEHRGFDLANDWLTAGRVMVAANNIGRAQRAFEMAAEWAATRRQFGKRIGEFQGTSFKLADMQTEIRAAELVTLYTAQKLDLGTMTDGDAALAKLLATETLGRVTDHAVQIYGGMGLMDELPIERFWRDARIERIWEGTSEIQRHILSKEILRRYS
ncbi:MULTISPECIES: acyl-CoA dehydrogenase family protein [Burkholderia]|uniref:acyl-CoA dehydrogenase family protein n=1 Tax=Burkholderia TaxID=32008 RepID=UPI00064FC77B|nr:MULTISPECIES: acyl-CoA dehydrogenase family protein [Burkholderia]KML12036.1 acyl-CoA dehydrogenase [Burkholderia cepacia]KML36756.1 acyl-CoA dehydrogenase [Burkholderia lata]KMN53697.1 acyl-CoA dehydrogenase [Burkholderia sp. LK4]KVF57663.1 acyl-CoA dehydrogenase [Burkholderia cepacia]KVQ24888.1 acyl-CoA dehydrogenase [Burkholderia cepacia]